MELNKEIIWKPIKGYEGLYEVSNTGLVKSLNKRLGEFNLATVTTIFGYLRVCLYKNKKKQCHTLHVLVAQTFIGDRPEGCNHINHKNGNKLDNRPENLEYCTAKYNIWHSRFMGLNKSFGATHHQAILSQKEVDLIKLIKQYKPKALAKDVCRIFGVCKETIYKIWQEKTWRIGNDIRQ